MYEMIINKLNPDANNDLIAVGATANTATIAIGGTATTALILAAIIVLATEPKKIAELVLFLTGAVAMCLFTAACVARRTKSDAFGIESQTARGRAQYGAFSSSQPNDEKSLLYTLAAGEGSIDTPEVVVEGPTPQTF